VTTALKEELTRILDENGALTPQLVVDAARSPQHPLHSRFEWDDAKAGEAYRRSQAAELIRTVKVERVTGEGMSRVRGFHSITRATSTSYEPIEQIEQDPVAKEILLRQVQRDLAALRRKYEGLDGFFKMAREAFSE